MYSPKIAEHLIPTIYRLARSRGQAMTTLVNEALTRYLADEAALRAADAAPQPVPPEPSSAGHAVGHTVPTPLRRAA